MNGPKFPALRLPAVSGGEVVIQDAVVLEAASSNRLIVSYASDGPSKFASNVTDHSSPHEGEMHSSDDSGNDNGDPPDPNDVLNASDYEFDPSRLSVRSPTFSRTLSMPQPAQLVQLSHPHKPNPFTPFTPQSDSNLYPSHSGDLEPFRELSVELADSIQMAIQTMLQISPFQVLDSAREEFSACSLSVPTPSMSAMFTAMKNLNYISANIANFCSETPRMKRLDDIPPPPAQVRVTTPMDFDLGEVLQCVGDALSGAASQIGVDLVLYHSDVGLNSVPVSGDESGVSYALSHIIRQVLSTARTGDSIEIGLIASPPPTPTQPEELMDDSLQQFTFRISHKYGTSDDPLSQNSLYRDPLPERAVPQFSTLLLRRLLHQIDADLVSDLPPPDSFLHGRTCEVKLALKRGRSSTDDSPENISLDAVLGKLLAFGDTLKGQKVTLYASSKGSFAHHLTSYLTAWGMDVSHVSPEGAMDGLLAPNFNLPSSFDATVKRLSAYGPKTASKKEPTLPGPEPLSFIVIDDDIDVLGERLEAFREAQQPPSMGVNQRKRPSLATHHRPKSSPQMARLLGETAILHPAPVVILHFTSLSKYKALKDVIARIIITYAATSTPLPEVMIIPKPAGPRRFLTALQTAVTKPTVDPDFSPNATSPTSPSVQQMSSFFGTDAGASRSASQLQNVTSSKTNRPPGSRSNSDRSTRTTKDSESLPPPASPLGLADSVEYFSEAAAQFGASPSSGLVIQSPDGQPAGIFFHPRGKNSRHPSSQSMERDKGQLQLPSPFKTDPVSFSALHQAAVASPIFETDNKLITESPTILSPLRTLSRKQTSPRPDEPPVVSDNTMITTPIEPSSSPITSMSPTSIEGAPLRRVLGKRPAQVNKTGTTGSANKKDKVPESNIVPPICVLIVDDNPINQTILSTFMKKKRIKYDVANNGQEAVDKWKTGEFHLILMDIQMPIMDGIQATKEIRRLEKTNAMAGYPPCSPEGSTTTPSSETPTSASSETTRSSSSPYRSSVIIVALTASSLSSDRVAALAAGCNDFLTKPVTLLWLNNKIIEWGSIKALQMWADPVRTSQAAQARDVADRLHVPARKGSPSLSRQASLGKGSSTSNPTAERSETNSHIGLSSTRTVVAGASRSPATPVSPGKIWGPFKPSSATRRANSSEGPSGLPPNTNTMPDLETAPNALSSPNDLTELRSDSLTPTARSVMPPVELPHNAPGKREMQPLFQEDPPPQTTPSKNPSVTATPEQPSTPQHRPMPPVLP